jgi:methylmalonyl-CoA mutase
MNENENPNKLFDEFPPVTGMEWESKVIADLKGADYAKKLIWKTAEGFDVKPYYRSEDLKGLEYLDVPPGIPPFIRGVNTKANQWLVRQDIPETDVEAANRKALDALSKGADAIGFNALEVTTHKQIHQLLDGIDLARTPVHFVHSRSYPLTLELFLYELSHREMTGEQVRGSLNFDFLSYLLLHGDFYITRENNLEEASYLLNTIQKKLPGFRAVTVNGHYFQDSGSTLVQELAFSLAAGNEYLSILTSRGFDADFIAQKMAFTFSIGSSYFMEIAKLRAARLLWAKIVEQYHPSDERSRKMFIHSQTALWNKTLYDPYVNLLRTTTEGMSAILGCTDSLTILPFDIAYRSSGDFPERIARNQQLVMKEESYLDKIVDPGAGSYYIETLTDSIATHAWNLFLEVEDRGGLVDCVKSGFVQHAVEESARQKEDDIARRKLVLLGTNQYPNTGEQMLEKEVPEGAPGTPHTSTYPQIKPLRIARRFEELRLSTEKYVAAGHKRPAVFLFTFGNLAMLRARAGFTTNFFGCAGYEIIDNAGFENPADGIKACLDSGAEIAVLCSSDEEYPLMTEAICSGLRKGNPGVIITMAGYPKETMERLKAFGIEEFIHVRSNLLETLVGYHKRLGIIK